MKILDEIMELADDAQAKQLSRFFKAGKGQYGEGDLFLGIKVPVTRSIAKKYYRDLSVEQLQNLIGNKYHEVRLLALLIMVMQYEKTDNKKEIFKFYLKNVNYINNWDLVDLSAPKIVGHFVFQNKIPAYICELANSGHLWSQRISVVSQLYSIKQGDFELIFKLSEQFLHHNHDLMQKAVGWMLREVGKIDEESLTKFLDEYSTVMPRTMLRYSIEKFSPETRMFYMKKPN